MSRSSSSSSGRDGLLLLDKPAGVSSRKAAAQAAREVGASKFGHAGTLDPFATGLLIVLLGRGCRTQDWFMHLPKEYLATARLGATSTTGDPEGEIIETGVMPPEPLELPTGKLMQRPPAYSAVHVNGRRAYKLARQGEEVELPEREVQVYAFEETGRDGNDVHLRIGCSSGTYVRSLVSDLGDAYTTSLRRTAIGPFDVSQADPTRIIDLAKAMPFLPTLRLSTDESTPLAHGRPVEIDREPEAPSWLAPGPAGGGRSGTVLVVDDEGVVALAERAQDGLTKAVVGFRG